MPIRNLFLLAISISFTAAYGHTASLTSKKVHFTIGEYPPYVTEKMSGLGFAFEIVSNAFAAVDIEVDHKFVPWPRAYEHTKHPEIFVKEKYFGVVTFPWVDNVERRKEFLFSNSIADRRDYLYYLKTNTLFWRDISDLQGLNIGVPSHTIYPQLDKAEKDGIVTLQRVGKYEYLFKRLMYRPVDAIVFESRVASFYMKELLTTKEQEQIAFSPTPVEATTYHVMIGKNQPNSEQVINLFNAGLEKIKKNGVYADILKSYQVKVDGPMEK